MDERLGQRLHTELLEDKYGLVHAVVLEHTKSRRIIDIVDKEGISRTHAITWFPEICGQDKISQIREEIASGALIGKTFKKYGFEKGEKWLIRGVIPIPEWLRNRFKVDSNFAHLLIYEFWARKDKVKFLYGAVAEINSPDFMKVSGDFCDIHKAQTSEYFDQEKLLKDLNDYLSTMPIEG